MSIADDLEKGAPQASPEAPSLEGATGQELALAVEASLRHQAESMVGLAEESRAAVGLAADQIVPFFESVLSGQSLMGEVLGRLSQRFAHQAPMDIKATIQAPEVSLPPSQGFDRKDIEAQFAAFIGPSNVRPVLPRLIQGGN